MPCALGAAPPRNPANSAVVFEVVLGSRSVEMQVTRSLVTPGGRAWRLVRVSDAGTECCVTHWGGYCAFETDFIACLNENLFSYHA